MLLYEYEAKEVFAQYHLPLPEGAVVYSPQEAERVAASLSGPVMLKAQVLTGGRGKLGGIQKAENPEEARKKAEVLLTMTIQGLKVKALLMERQVAIAEEYYVGFTKDKNLGQHSLIISDAGGVHVEEGKQKIIYPQPVGSALYLFRLREFFNKRGFGEDLRPEQKTELLNIIGTLYHIYLDYEAVVAEINPLVLTREGRFLPVDARLNLDSNAFFRNNRAKIYWEQHRKDDEEIILKEYGIDFVPLDGDIALFSVGAGNTMATMDLIAQAGRRPACFLDFSKGIKKESFKKALQVIQEMESVKAICMNVFGGLTRMDLVAQTLVEALAEIPRLAIPLTVRLEGTNVKKGREILSRHGITQSTSLTQVVEKTVELGGYLQ